jgi:hypothetical protein
LLLIQTRKTARGKAAAKDAFFRAIDTKIRRL